MAKIAVPQELVEKIIYLYTKENYTRKRIKTELNLPFGDSVIKRILLENNIPIKTNPGAQAGGRKKQVLSQELINKIVQMYKNGESQIGIVKKLHLNFSVDKVRDILKENGVELRSVHEVAQLRAYNTIDLRKYKINDNYPLNSHNGAWLLGFITADGYLPNTKGARHKVVITLARKDKNLLEMIAQELEYTGPIYDFESNNGYPCSSLSFTSKKLREQIESYGIVNAKTYKLTKIPNISDEYKIDFIRGFFDGDGSVYFNKNHGAKGRIVMDFTCASKPFLQDIQSFLKKNYPINSQSKIIETIRVNPVYDLRYSTKDSLILGMALYNNNFLALERKKQVFFQLKNIFNKENTPTSLNTPQG